MSGIRSILTALVFVLVSAALASLSLLAAIDMVLFQGTLFGRLDADAAPVPVSAEVFSIQRYGAAVPAAELTEAGYVGRAQRDGIYDGSTEIGRAEHDGGADTIILPPAGADDVPAADAESVEDTEPANADAPPESGVHTASDASIIASGMTDDGLGVPDSVNAPQSPAAAKPAAVPVTTIDGLRRFLSNEKYIIHAGGYLNYGWKHDYTNCREALENCYESGNHVCELDFMETSDGYFICGHDGTGAWVYGLPYTEPQDLDTFLTTPMFDAFTTMDLAYVASFLRENPDFYIVTDVKDRNVAFCKTVNALYPDLTGRFIIQIYHESEYDSVHDLGFPFIIYTLYMTTNEEHRLSALTSAVENHDLVGLTFFQDWVNDKNFMTAIRKLGVPLYVHTVNDRDKQKMFFDLGISAVYTDEVNNTDWR